VRPSNQDTPIVFIASAAARSSNNLYHKAIVKCSLSLLNNFVSAVTNGAINFLVPEHYGHSESRNLYRSFYERVNVKTTAAGVAQSVSLISLMAARPRFQKDGQDMQHRLRK